VHALRKKGDKTMKNEKKMTPLKAIREKCKECSCGSLAEVRLCKLTDCALYPYRFGKKPRKKN
jgi:hypothetical protein